MRLLTALVLVGLLVVSAVAFANGHSGGSVQPNQSIVVPQPPVGTGPTDVTPTTPVESTPMTPMEGTSTTTSTTTTTTLPPVSTAIMSSEVETFNTNNVVSEFHVDRTSVMQLRAAGWSWGDIYIMSNIAQKSGRQLMAVATLRSQNMAWADIASNYSLTAMDITASPTVVTRVAGFTTEYGYQPLYYKADPWGNPVLTRYDAQRFERLGYSWQDIAVAANISAKTGASISDVLAWTDRGYTWNQVAREYGLNPNSVLDISQYPFTRSGGQSKFFGTQPVGAGPSMVPGSVQPGIPTNTVPTY